MPSDLSLPNTKACLYTHHAPRSKSLSHVHQCTGYRPGVCCGIQRPPQPAVPRTPIATLTTALLHASVSTEPLSPRCALSPPCLGSIQAAVSAPPFPRPCRCILLAPKLLSLLSLVYLPVSPGTRSPLLCIPLHPFPVSWVRRECLEAEEHLLPGAGSVGA